MQDAVENAALRRTALAPEQLRRHADPSTLPFETTAEVAPLQDTIGQPRAIDAIEFGLEVTAFGYNIFVAGAPGSGRETTVRGYLERLALTKPQPADWIYVHNFDRPDNPKAISLPAGRGAALARDMDAFIKAAQREIPRAFDSEEYDRRRRDAISDIANRRQALLQELQAFAQARGFALEMTSTGIASAPVGADGKPLTSEEFERLPPLQRQALEKGGEEIQSHVSATMRQVRQLEKEAGDKIRALDHDVAMFAVGPLVANLREEYEGCSDVQAFLDHVQKDLPDHLDDFRPAAVQAQDAETPAALAQLQRAHGDDVLARYRVNALVDNGKVHGAPVVVERNPTYYNLAGRIDYRAALGALVTDFREIKPGALQRANGGFLVVSLPDLLRNPFAWDALKRALMNREIRMENLGEQLNALPTATLRPEPIPLDVKVVLIGPPGVFELLRAQDEDFRETFKVKADFAPDMDWSDANVMSYAAFVARHVRETGLRHLDRSAVGRVLEYGARLREHQHKLSTRFIDVADVVTEASYWAGKSGRDVVTAADVDQAIAKKTYRSNLVEERLREMIADGTIMIDTGGERVGQVNGMAVADLGDYVFGNPTRITAQVSLGRGTVQSIEREIALSGPIHSKGVLILSGYLAGTYAQDWPFALGATITFEQSYDEVEGDSASSTELYALLSALSGLPLKQGIAVTGSVNQHGEVQAVGGVTRKIEGFFAVCKARGLTGRQGIIIPAANAQNLMLDDEIVAAARDGLFHIFTVRTIDEGMEILSGRPAGERATDGSYLEGSVHRLVQERLRHYADQLGSYAAASISPDGHAAQMRPTQKN